MRQDTIVVAGTVGSDPQERSTAGGVPMLTFRLASNDRYFDRTAGEWVDGDTNWYSVQAFRQLASNAARSLRRGESVVVTGKLRIRSWRTEEKSGTTVDIDADIIGHNLARGTSSFQRNQPASGAPGGPQIVGDGDRDASAADGWAQPMAAAAAGAGAGAAEDAWNGLAGTAT